MYSYIALTWEPSDRSADAAAGVLRGQLALLADFTIVTSAPGLHVVQKPGLKSACGACLLPDNQGAILGTVFSWPTDTQAPERQHAMPGSHAAKIVASDAEHLVTHFWGRYVAFIRSPATAQYAVVRDPSGMLPCFQTTHSAVRIWFSRLEDLSTLQLPLQAINWSYLEKFAALNFTRSHETGLLNVHEVLAGERWDFETGELRRTIVWSPEVCATTNVVEDAAEAAQRLRSVTLACIDAWAGAYDGILHTLSGGVDSSIVAVMLGQTSARTPVTCANYYTAEPEGDERFYARLVAQKAGFKLLERPRTPRSVDLRRALTIAKTPSPWNIHYGLENYAYELTQAHLHGAGAIFGGGGGDGIFYRADRGFCVSDYIQRHGLDRGLVSVAMNAARLDGKSIWSVAWSALRGRANETAKKWTAEAMKYNGLASEKTMAAARAARPEHASPALLAAVPPGKRWHIFTTSIPPGFYDEFNDPQALERVHPLVSQPVVEHCLKIPTYVLLENGWDRAIARRAFQNDLPAEIVNRRGKGSMQNYALAMFHANTRFLREFMLDGELVRRGLLDKEAVERCLGANRSKHGHEFTEIQNHFTTEAWVRRHSEPNAQSAVA